MNLNERLLKIYSKFSDNYDIFTRPRSKDENFLNKFKEPVDDIERSFYQYKCQKWCENSKIKYICGNIVAFFLVAPQVVMYRRNRKNCQLIEKTDAVLTRQFLKDLLPEQFTGRYVCQDFNEGSLSRADIKFLRRIWMKHPLSFYFLYKCLNRVAAYSDFIKKYNPDIVFCSAEYSFTSSVLTLYCEKNNVLHKNVMHGEKLFYLRDTFSRFHYFYVWDEHYIKLLRKLRADKTKYIVSPITVPKLELETPKNSCVYYLGGETGVQLKSIKEYLESTGLEYLVRPHPSYNLNGEMIQSVFGTNHIENSKEINIWDSIRAAGYIISLHSTVLYQASLAGATVVIDDLTDPNKYRSLCERDYIMMSRPHLLLSQFIG